VADQSPTGNLRSNENIQNFVVSGILQVMKGIKRHQKERYLAGCCAQESPYPSIPYVLPLTCTQMIAVSAGRQSSVIHFYGFPRYIQANAGIVP
jgi:hypothetical protein